MSTAAINKGETAVHTLTERDVKKEHWIRSIAMGAGIAFGAAAIGARMYSHDNPIEPILLTEFAGTALCGLLLEVSAKPLRVEWPKTLAGTAIGFGLLVAFTRALTSSSSAFFLWGWLVTFFGLLFSRYTGLLFSTQRSAKVPLPLVILGEAEVAKCLYKAVLKSSRVAQRDLRIAGIFADGAQERSEGVLNDTIVSDAKWAKSFAECCEIHNGIVAVPTKCDPKTTELVKACAAIFRNLYIAPKIIDDEVTAVVRLDRNSCLEIQVGGSSYFIENNSLHDSEIPDCGRLLSRQSSGEGHFLKRAVDVLGSLVVGLLTLPFLLLVAAAIVLTSKGSILYKQLRIGKGNRMFFALKFRTMFVDAHERLDHYLGKDTALREQWDSLHKLKNDPRVTFVGRFLRRFSLDELPQLWNVLVGDMSLIGPRPIIVSEIERYGRDYAAYEAVRPGLTGLWQVSGRNDTTYQERVDLDSYYVRNWSMGLDLRIFLKTFRAVISGLGAY